MLEEVLLLGVFLCRMCRPKVSRHNHLLIRLTLSLPTVTTESRYGLVPVHSARLSVAEAETRVDYMSSCILLGRASHLVVAVRDLWEGLQLAGQQTQTEEANIQVYIPLLPCSAGH